MAQTRLLGLIAALVMVNGCAMEPSLIQVECENIYLGSYSYKARKVKYWSDGSTTFEKVYPDGTWDGEWQYVYLPIKGSKPCD